MWQTINNFFHSTGFSAFTWGQVLMILVSFVLMYLAIKKGFEPLLLVPIAFGMFLTNLPLAGLMAHPVGEEPGGLLYYLYQGDHLGIFPPLIFLGVGAMTDFGPLIANPKSLLLGAAIGGADGPTAIFLSSKLARHLMGSIAVAAYSYMALVPVIQPPIMKALTTEKERKITMKQLREVSRLEKLLFPVVVTLIVSLVVPPAAALVGMLMLGNLFRESGVVNRLSDTAQNALMNIVTIFLGVTVGATATAEAFLRVQTLAIIALGVVAFGIGTAAGLLLAKLMNAISKDPINPLIGSAGVSAVPMAARVSQVVGQKANPSNFLLMHAMGPNVAGVIGSAVSAGVLLTLFGGF